MEELIEENRELRSALRWIIAYFSDVIANAIDDDPLEDDRDVWEAIKKLV